MEAAASDTEQKERMAYLFSTQSNKDGTKASFL